ncbi:MAG TPA: MFS transporter [Rectinemataceae bacterium]|nr:MFS transporter [Rectinemataceae bacterium]
MKTGMRMFALIWGGQIVSVIGSQLSGFALAVWVYDTTRSATLSALAYWAFSLPQILLSPFAGVWVDRWGRRKSMIISDLGAGLCVGIVALLWYAGALRPWMIVPINIGISSFASLMWPAQSAAITVLVPKEHYGRANGMVQTIDAVAMLVGPALAGALYATLKVGKLALIDAASYVVAIAIMVLLVKIPEPSLSAEGGKKTPLLEDIKIGWRWIVERRGLVALLSYFLLVNLLSNFVNPLFDPYVLDAWNPATLGWIASILGLGMLAGTLTMSAWGGTKRRILTLLGSGVLNGIFLALGGFATSPSLLAFAGAAMMFFLPFMNASSQAIWQAKVAPELQGRVFAVRRSIAWSSGIIAPLLAGPLADLVFKPGMSEGGGMSRILGPLLGVGPARGIGLMFILIGLSTALVSLLSFGWPLLMRLETELPDHGLAEANAMSED